MSCGGGGEPILDKELLCYFNGRGLLFTGLCTSNYNRMIYSANELLAVSAFVLLILESRLQQSISAGDEAISTLSNT